MMAQQRRLFLMLATCLGFCMIYLTNKVWKVMLHISNGILDSSIDTIDGQNVENLAIVQELRSELDDLKRMYHEKELELSQLNSNGRFNKENSITISSTSNDDQKVNLDSISSKEEEYPIPSALQNTTNIWDEKCYHQKKSDPKNCMGTCYTEEAFGDLWPFTTAEQKIMYEEYHYPSREKEEEHKLHCRNTYSNTKPSTIDWCNTTSIGKDDHGCGHHGSFQHFYLFPTAKLAFCGIPKVGITQWLQFLRFTAGAKDYQSFPHAKNDINNFKFDNRHPLLRQSVLQDPSWTKAIFLRDPAERLLSAYLDKIEKNPKMMFPQLKENKISFEEFVDIISVPTTINNVNSTSKDSNDNPEGIQCIYLPKGSYNFGLTWCTDPHWRPQVWSCGLYKMLPYFQFVGSMNDMANHTKRLLDNVGLWQTHGKYYRVSSSNQTDGEDIFCKRKPPLPLKPGEATPPGFQQLTSSDGSDGMDTHSHNTGSRAKMNDYYTPELLEKVRELYADDYLLWDVLEQTKDTDGRRLYETLNPDCLVD